MVSRAPLGWSRKRLRWMVALGSPLLLALVNVAYNLCVDGLSYPSEVAGSHAPPSTGRVANLGENHTAAECAACYGSPGYDFAGAKCRCAQALEPPVKPRVLEVTVV